MFYYLNFTMTASYFNQKKGNSQRQNGFVFLKSHSLEVLVYARAQQHTTRPFSPFSKLVNSIFKLAIFLSFEEISLQSLQQTKPQMFYYSNFIMTTPYFNKKKGNSWRQNGLVFQQITSLAAFWRAHPHHQHTNSSLTNLHKNLHFGHPQLSSHNQLYPTYQ